ncbi:MAG: hypothetical protein SO135_05200 [Sphaerochaetaceae bacterium]|jgi:hypothetical protein|nr:hypothetical protein [Sphaerochaetaceae bacterium]NLY06703.1 hypothetical protein [Spirochaetales bacterium]
MQGKNRLSEYRLFEYFTSALSEVQRTDVQILSWQKPKMAFCFRLASYLQNRMDELFVDVQPCAENRLSPLCDILVHSRDQEDYRPLAIICKPDYLCSTEQNHLIQLGSDSGTLALGISFFPARSYFLIYRALQDRMEYYHFDRETLSCEPLKSRDLQDCKEDEAQLTLKLPRTRARKNSVTRVDSTVNGGNDSEEN